MSTANNKYIPTPAEQKLLEVLCNPNSLGKSITDICDEAGVDRGVYYKAIAKPEFFEYRNKFIMDILKAGIGDIILASMKYGKENPKNNADRIALMKMAGIYEDVLLNKNVNINTEASPEDVAKIKEKYGLID